MFAFGLIVGLIVGIVITNIVGALWLSMCQAAGKADEISRMECHPRIVNDD